MSQFKLTTIVDSENPVEGDLDLVAGQIVLIGDFVGEEDSFRINDEVAAIAQDLRQRLNFFKGEWFLNLLEGFPYFQEVFKKNPDQALLRALFRNTIIDTNGIESVETLDISLNTATRRAELTFSARLNDGGVLQSSDFPPFIVELP